jgi:hypothetical protein
MDQTGAGPRRPHDMLLIGREGKESDKPKENKEEAQ